MGCKERSCVMPAKPNGFCTGHQWKAPREAPPPGSVEVGKTLDAPIITFESSMRPTTPVTRESVLPAWKRMEEWLVRNPGVPISYADLAKHISRSETTVKTAVSNFPKRFEAPFGMVRLKSWPQEGANGFQTSEDLLKSQPVPSITFGGTPPSGYVLENPVPVVEESLTTVLPERTAQADNQPEVDTERSSPQGTVDLGGKIDPVLPAGVPVSVKEHGPDLSPTKQSGPILDFAAAEYHTDPNRDPVVMVNTEQIPAADSPAPFRKSCLTPFTQVPATVASPLPRHGPYSDRLLELMACYGCDLEDGPGGDAMSERMIDDIVQLSETAWNYREAKRITDAALLAANIFGNASYSAMVEAVQPLVQEIRDLRWHIRQIEMRASSPGK